MVTSYSTIIFNINMQTFKEKKQDIRDKLADIACTFKGIEKAIEISTNLASILATDELRRDLNKLENEINSIINN